MVLSPKEQARHDNYIYNLAYEHLIKLITNKEEEDKSRADVFNRQIETPHKIKPKSLSAVYRQLIGSCMNANRLPRVVPPQLKGGGLDALSAELFDFDPHRIISSFSNEQALACVILNEPHEAARPKSLIGRYVKSIYTSATFLSIFKDAEEFYHWADKLNSDEFSRSALPLLISSEVEGMGFTLACDFLKELGYPEFGKPDVHIKDILLETGLCNNRDDIKVFRALQRMAKSCGVSPFQVDKVFWLIGSGKFYEPIGNIGASKKQFLKNYASSRVLEK
jgi:hypothetical protein